MTTYRVSYINSQDGKRRVLAGNLTHAHAEAVMDKWGNPQEANFYMGEGTRMEPCDGTRDGALLPDAP